MATNLNSLLGGGGGGIKSVQRGTSYMNYTDYNLFVDITAVNLSKSFLVFSNTGPNDAGRGTVTGRLNSTTQLFFGRDVNGTGISVLWEVIEFE